MGQAQTNTPRKVTGIVLLAVSMILYIIALFLPAVHQFGEQGLVNIPSKDYLGYECVIWGILAPIWWCANPLLWQSWARSTSTKKPRFFGIQLPVVSYGLGSALLAFWGLGGAIQDWKSGNFAAHDSPILLGAYMWLGSIVVEAARTCVMALWRE